MKLKHLLLIALLILCIVPVMGQDATLEATVDAAPVTVIDGQGEGDTIVNVGGETPVGETPETPTEPMPWWAVAALEITKLTGLYLVVVHGIREAVKAFMANPARVRSAEDAVNLAKSLIPDAIEEAARKAGEKAAADTHALIEDLRRAVTALTDGVAEASKTKPTASSLSGTTSGYTVNSTPGVSSTGETSGFSG